MFDRGFFITLQAIRRQLAAMPHEIYLIRLIHHTTREPFPGERLWTAPQLGYAPAVRFLRMRNREGCDIYLQPYAAQDRNAGYILVDLDRANPAVIESMRANGHEPCVVHSGAKGESRFTPMYYPLGGPARPHRDRPPPAPRDACEVRTKLPRFGPGAKRGLDRA